MPAYQSPVEHKQTSSSAFRQTLQLYCKVQLMLEVDVGLYHACIVTPKARIMRFHEK